MTENKDKLARLKAVRAGNRDVITKLYKACRTAVFSSFYNILRPNVAVLLILRCSF